MQCHIPDHNLNLHHCGNLKSHMTCTELFKWFSFACEQCDSLNEYVVVLFMFLCEKAVDVFNFFQTHCPNLQVLDLSNLRTVAHTTAPLHVEKLQEGCQKLRVLRITNSQIALSTASLKEQVHIYDMQLKISSVYSIYRTSL